MTSWHSYPKIYNMGHAEIVDLLTGDVIVEEKVDGSQFSFGVFDGVLKVRSKGCEMIPDAPEGMFLKAVEAVKSLVPVLHHGWTYRGEYLAKPKHNALVYERTPKLHIILFDINDGHESFLSRETKEMECARIGLECVPLLFLGKINNIDEFRQFLDRTSILGGQKVEGVVIKPAKYDLFGRDKHVKMGKFVSEAFKEVHSREWKNANPSQNDILDRIGEEYRSDSRWHKAVQHLTENGHLEGSPRDIGKLMKEVPMDIEKECLEEIKDKLWAWAWPHIRRKATAGLPEWYKEQLLKKQFDVPVVPATTA